MSVLDSPSAPLLASATGRRASTANATQRIVVLLLEIVLIIIYAICICVILMKEKQCVYSKSNHGRKSRALVGLFGVCDLFSVVAKLRKFYRLKAGMNAKSRGIRWTVCWLCFSSNELCLRMRSVYAFSALLSVNKNNKE